MKTLAIATNTFREKVRDRILYVILAFAVLMIAGSVLLGKLSLNEQIKIVKDAGLTAISLFGAVMAIFLGVGLVSQEIERRTIYTILSKPVRRGTFLAGKYLGLILTLTVNVLAMSFLHLILLKTYGVKFDVLYIIAIYFLLLELMLTTAIALFFSTFSSTILSILFTSGFYVIGHLLEDLKTLGEKSESMFVKKITHFLYYALPNMDFHNLKPNVTYNIAVEPSMILLVTLYTLAYISLLLFLSIVVFNRREFK
jgi:ABC-type transport system involved in multi-copper enzyme maturation permease subunit